MAVRGTASTFVAFSATFDSSIFLRKREVTRERVPLVEICPMMDQICFIESRCLSGKIPLRFAGFVVAWKRKTADTDWRLGVIKSVDYFQKICSIYHTVYCQDDSLAWDINADQFYDSSFKDIDLRFVNQLSGRRPQGLALANDIINKKDDNISCSSIGPDVTPVSLPPIIPGNSCFRGVLPVWLPKHTHQKPRQSGRKRARSKQTLFDKMRLPFGHLKTRTILSTGLAQCTSPGNTIAFPSLSSPGLFHEVTLSEYNILYSMLLHGATIEAYGELVEQFSVQSTTLKMVDLSDCPQGIC